MDTEPLQKVLVRVAAWPGKGSLPSWFPVQGQWVQPSKGSGIETKMVKDGEAEGAGSVQPEEEKGKLRSHHNLQRPDRRGMRQLFPEVRGGRWESPGGTRGNPC